MVSIQTILYSEPDHYPPIINGAHVLADAGHQQYILSRIMDNRYRISYPHSVEIARIVSQTRSSLLEYLNFIRKALTWARLDTDIFIGHEMHGFLIVRLLGWRYRKPVIYHCHDFVETQTSLTFGATLVKQFERCFARTADLVIVPDRERAVIVADQLRLKQFPCVVANAPLRTPDKTEGILRAVLSEHGYYFDKIVLRQGTIGPSHCIDVTIRSIPLWEDPKWGFVVMGRGDKDYKESLLQLAKKLNVQDRFVILPEVSYTDVMKYTVDADLGHALYQQINVNHVFSSTASNKVMEYMAVGCPALLSETNSNRAFLCKYPMGVMARVDDPQAIAAAINKIFTEPSTARRMGDIGRRAFNKYFRYDRQYQPVLDYLSSLPRNRKRA